VSHEAPTITITALDVRVVNPPLAVPHAKAVNRFEVAGA
jgi:hypothetical protein